MTVDAVVKDYSGQLRRFLSRRVRRKSDVEDLLQEILVKTLRHWSTLREARHLRAWLFKTARTTLIDYYRRNDRSFDAGAMINEDSGEDPGVRAQLGACLKVFFRQLPLPYRRALEAVELNGESQAALARRLRLSPSAVKSRVQRGRRMLLKLFKSCCAFEKDVTGRVVDFSPRRGSCAGCAAH